MRQTDKYLFFWHGFLGQWFRSPFTGPDGYQYTHAEQWMMAEKARLFNDNYARMRIMQSIKPREQQAIGREVKFFNEDVWNKNAREIVFQGNMLKFGQDENLKKLLLDTGNVLLVEASPIDKVWGVGLAENDPLIDDPVNWRGKNWLGETLTRVRETLKGKT